MKYRFLFSTAIVLLTVFSLLNPSAAEDAYSWKDKSGRTIYGSKPPKGATGVTGLKTNSLSRYSSDKVLKRLGWSEDSSRAKLSSDEQAEVEIPIESTEVEPLSPAELKSLSPRIERNEAGDILSCEVDVENSGGLSANSVSVSFSFPDGTLIPGIGPEEIAPNSKASYKVPDELLPFSTTNNLDDQPVAEAVVPSVIIDSEGSLLVGD